MAQEIHKIRVDINMTKLAKGQSITHCSIFDKKASNAMNVNEHFFRIGNYLAQIDNILNALGHTCIM